MIMEKIDQYKIALDIFYSESKAQQWLFNSHFIVHSILLSFLLSQVNKYHMNKLVLILFGAAGIILCFLFFLGYRRSSLISGYRMDHLKYLEMNAMNGEIEFYSGNAEDYVRKGGISKYRVEAPTLSTCWYNKNKNIRNIITWIQVVSATLYDSPKNT